MLEDTENLASVLADELDVHGEWNWTAPNGDRVGILAGDDCWWLVYRGGSPDYVGDPLGHMDIVWRFESRASVEEALDRGISAYNGCGQGSWN